MLACARELAHRYPHPPGAYAFHATRSIEIVLQDGLRVPSVITGACAHICLSTHPGVAAALAPGAVLAVDISGMTMFFEEGEVRCHEPIPPSRLRVLDPQPEPLPAMPGWKDPGFRHNHSDCLVRLGYPTLRRSVFREATARAELLNERGEYTFEQYRAIVRELAEH